MTLQVVLASQGYPGSYEKGSAIRGIDSVSTAKVSSIAVPSKPLSLRQTTELLPAPEDLQQFDVWSFIMASVE